MEYLRSTLKYHTLIIGGGFTLIELLVVFAIIITITTVALSSQSSFNKSLILANTAYDIALSLKAAETYGIGSKAAGVDQNAGYGLHFDNAQQDKFVLFADKFPSASYSSSCHPIAAPNEPGAPLPPSALSGDCIYNSGQSETISAYTLGNGITVNNLCAYASGGWTCSLSSLDIIFTRPNAKPFISKNGTYQSGAFKVTEACIRLTSPHGGVRYVSVKSSGLINGNAPSCP